MSGMAARLAIAALALAASAFARADAPPNCGGRDLSLDPAIKPDFAKRADDLLNGEGLLWELDKPGLAPSYLYGTIHSTQSGPLDLARKAAQYIDGAKTVATELGGPFDSADKVNMSAGMVSAALAPDRDTFADVVGDDDKARLEAFVAGHGFPVEMAHHMQLWFLAVATSLPACEIEGQQKGLPEVDETLAQIARSHGVPVVALESMDEQIGAIAATPPRLAASMLVATSRDPKLGDDEYATLLGLYQRKSPSRALAVLEAAPGLSDEERAAETQFSELLLVGRNETMMQRASPLLEKGGAFIAVGALHLSGKGGLIERARAAGYKVTKVW